MRRTRVLFTLLISSALITSGCGTNSPNVKEEVNRQCEELIDYLGKDDTNGLKELFCSVVSDSQNFDSNLLEAVEFFDGTVTSYDIKSIGSDQKTDHGNTEIIHVSPKIWDIETSTGKSYKISYYAYIVNSDNPEYVGISEIQIKSEDGNEFKLGDYSLANPR
ncbi:MAG: DUF5104 domain-containing protein [Bacteroidaceae bacterium]|nr:DUF5104 domain-containing protein [Bacteroidaceae bacterium]